MTGGVAGQLDVAVSEAAGALAFVDAIPVDGSAEPEDGRCVLLELIDPREGTLVVRMAEADARTVSEMAWGALASGNDVQTDQFLAEFANVVAGRLLAMLFPGEPIRMGLPQHVPAAQAPPASGSRVYDLEGLRMWVGLSHA